MNPGTVTLLRMPSAPNCDTALAHRRGHLLDAQEAPVQVDRDWLVPGACVEVGQPRVTARAGESGVVVEGVDPAERRVDGGLVGAVNREGRRRARTRGADRSGW